LRRDTHVFFVSAPGSFFVMISLPVVVLWICGNWMRTSGLPISAQPDQDAVPDALFPDLTSFGRLGKDRGG